VGVARCATCSPRWCASRPPSDVLITGRAAPARSYRRASTPTRRATRPSCGELRGDQRELLESELFATSRALHRRVKLRRGCSRRRVAGPSLRRDRETTPFQAKAPGVIRSTRSGAWDNASIAWTSGAGPATRPAAGDPDKRFFPRGPVLTGSTWFPVMPPLGERARTSRPRAALRRPLNQRKGTRALDQGALLKRTAHEFPGKCANWRTSSSRPRPAAGIRWRTRFPEPAGGAPLRARRVGGWPGEDAPQQVDDADAKPSAGARPLRRQPGAGVTGVDAPHHSLAQMKRLGLRRRLIAFPVPRKAVQQSLRALELDRPARRRSPVPLRPPL